MIKITLIRSFYVISFIFAVVIFQNANASSCPATGMSAITSVNFGCMFPIRIGGTVSGGSREDDSDSGESPVCLCNNDGNIRWGLNVQMWEPARLIDTVTDPYCIMPLGKKITGNQEGKLSGGSDTTADSFFAQMHIYHYPALAMLDLFTDVQCLERTEFDIAFMSEYSATWQNDVLASVIHPESILFANPVSLLGCVADAAASTLNKPVDPLFWCLGSWSTSVYPLGGSISGGDFLQANAGLAARGIYMMSRLGLMRDTSESACYYTYRPIWKKSSYKLQMVAPVSDSNCLTIGKSSLLWGSGKHPPVGKDNFMFMMFRKMKCCINYNY